MSDSKEEKKGGKGQTGSPDDLAGKKGEISADGSRQQGKLHKLFDTNFLVT
jgi:hypothetical protein